MEQEDFTKLEDDEIDSLEKCQWYEGTCNDKECYNGGGYTKIKICVSRNKFNKFYKCKSFLERKFQN